MRRRIVLATYPRQLLGRDLDMVALAHLDNALLLLLGRRGLTVHCKIDIAAIDPLRILGPPSDENALLVRRIVARFVPLHPPEIKTAGSRLPNVKTIRIGV